MAKNNKTRFFYVLYSDKTRVFDQSERAYYSIYIIKESTKQLELLCGLTGLLPSEFKSNGNICLYILIRGL